MKQVVFSLLAVLFSVSMTYAQSRITGKVTDVAGESLIGASVTVKENPSVGTITDVDGMYEMVVPAGGQTLVFSYTGYNTKEMAIGGATVVNISLEEGKLLDEVVIVGYGAQSKKDVTGSITKVKGEAVAELISPSFVQQLAGRAAGVQIQNTSGILGSAPQIRIRGVNSISSGTQPLIVIDGVPAISENRSSNTPTNALGDINPNDIESYEILKDGAATAIYGSRAANGVVLITTKKGKAGKPQFTYDMNYGVASATKLFDLLNAQDFVTIQNEKYTNAGSNPVANLQTRADGSIVDTDWQSLIFRNAAQQTHNLSVSGGNENTKYFFSLGYANMEGIAVANSLDRLNFRANLEQKVNNWLSAGIVSGVTNQNNFGPLTGSNNLSGNIFGVIRMLPNVEALNPDHPTGYNVDLANPRALGRGANNDVVANGIPNQLFVLENDVRKANSLRIMGNAYLQAQITDGLTFRTQLGMDRNLVNQLTYLDARHGDGFGSNGFLTQLNRDFNRWNWQNSLNYNKTFAKKHNLGITLVQEYEKVRSTFYGATGQTISDIYFQENIITGTAATQIIEGGIGENGIASYLGRVNYNYNSKYYLSASLRRDALSKLAPDGRIGIFPGVSFAYRISEEGFWDGLRDIISDFRIRGSFAQTGNTNIGDYPYIGSYGSGQYGSQNGITYSNFGNDQLTWESQDKLDFGFDMGLMNNKYNVSFAYWRQDNRDIILEAPTAPSLGIPNNFINSNVGRIQSDGIELTLDANLINKAKFKWNASFNFSTNNNKVLELVNGNDIITSYNIIREGESIRSIYGYVYRGVNAANGNPLYETYNRDENGNITETIVVQGNIANQTYYVYDANNPTELGTARALSATRDRVVLGSVLPTYFGGFDNNFTIGNFDVNIFLRYSGGNKIMNRTRIDLLSQSFNNNSEEILGRWQSPENPGDGQTPRLFLNRDAFTNLGDFASTRFVEDGSFLRLQNVSVGYNFPTSMLRKIKIQGLKVYVQAQNLLTFTEYSGLDPESASNFSTSTGFGEDFNSNPQQKVISGGLKLSF